MACRSSDPGALHVMRPINAQFRQPWRPSRGALAGLSALLACTVASVAGAAWERRHVVDLQTQESRLIEADRTDDTLSPARPAPPYEASARQLVRERGAAWAPMLRTLESGAMVGVTPTSVEFDASDEVARVELSYSDSTMLSGYLARINEGVVPEPGRMRWTLVQTREQPAASQKSDATAMGTAPSRANPSAATIRSNWEHSTATGMTSR